MRLQRSAWKRIRRGKVLLRCVCSAAREALGRPRGRRGGGGILCRHAHSLLLLFSRKSRHHARQFLWCLYSVSRLLSLYGARTCFFFKFRIGSLERTSSLAAVRESSSLSDFKKQPQNTSVQGCILVSGHSGQADIRYSISGFESPQKFLQTVVER